MVSNQHPLPLLTRGESPHAMAAFRFSLLLFLSTCADGFLNMFPSLNHCITPQSHFNRHDDNVRLLGASAAESTNTSGSMEHVLPILELSNSTATHRTIDATSLAERNMSASPYQIARPRWYNKAEAAVIVLLVQRLRLVDVRGVEHMLETTDAFRKQDPRAVYRRACYLMKVAPGANFRTVIQRHPRTLLVPLRKMKLVYELIRDAYPDANMARVIERIPSVFSRNATKLERNIAGLQEFAPEVDSAIFQAAPSMLFLPPATVDRKVTALRLHLPGINLHTFLKGMPTALARSHKTVPRGLDELRKRFPTSSSKELVRIVEAAPSLVRMSGLSGSLDIKVDSLMALLPGVNVSTIISNAPGVLIRSSGSLTAKVEKLAELFPSANMTKIVSRTPGVLYLDMDRTVKPKAIWIKQSIDLDQEGLDRLIEQGPWLLKAGWGPLARLQFAVDSGLARKDRPAGIVGLVRRSKTAFAMAHHPAYANFLRRRLEEEGVETEAGTEVENEVEDLTHPRAWRARGSGRSGDHQATDHKEPSGVRSVIAATTRLKDAAISQASASDAGVLLDLDGETNAGGNVDGDLEAKTAADVARLEDRLGRWRKSRMGGVKDRPMILGPSSVDRLDGSPRNGDALLDLERGTIVRRDPRIGA